MDLLEAMRRHLTRDPSTVNGGRITRLRGVSQPQYRMRASNIGVFYDVTETQIEVVAIVPKSKAHAWVGE